MQRISYSVIKKKYHLVIIAALFLFGLFSISANAQNQVLNGALPKSGKLVNNKPTGKGWENLLLSADEWNFEGAFWQLNNNSLQGKIGKEKEHHYGYTKKSYGDFELLVSIKMVGDDDANSGVCIRINPTNWDNAPGYQVDMGKGYWGSLWEERRGEMVQKYPDSLAMKLANKNDWNEYYIIAKGHHVQAWLNGVKTIDVIHEAGFTEGNIGF